MASFVTDHGLENVIWAWADPGVYDYARTMRFGTGSGQDVTATDLAASAQTGEATVKSIETTAVANDTVRHTATITADAERVITEVGVIDDANLMEVYGDFDPISLAVGDAITFQVNVIVTQSAA